MPNIFDDLISTSAASTAVLETPKKNIFDDILPTPQVKVTPTNPIVQTISQVALAPAKALSPEVLTPIIEETFKAGARYPKGILKTVEDVQLGKGPQGLLGNIFNPEQDKRTATQISQDVGNRMYDNPSTSVAWEFIKQLPFTTAGKLAEWNLDPAIALTFAGITKTLAEPAIAEYLAKPISAPKWFDDTISNIVKNTGNPLSSVAKNVKEGRINALVDEVYSKFEPRMDELKANYKATYGMDPQPGDIKGLIKAKLVQGGVYDSSILGLQAKLIKTRGIEPLKAAAESAPITEAPAAEALKTPVLPIQAKPGEVIAPETAVIPGEAPIAPVGPILTQIRAEKGYVGDEQYKANLETNLKQYETKTDKTPEDLKYIEETKQRLQELSKPIAPIKKVKIDKVIYKDYYNKEINDRAEAVKEINDYLQGNPDVKYRLKKNIDNTIILYHGTTEENANAILKSGNLNEGSFFSHAKTKSAFGSGGANYYGKGGKIIELKVDPRDVSFGATGEFYAEKGLIRGEDGVWRSPDRKTFSQLSTSTEGKVSENQQIISQIKIIKDNVSKDIGENSTSLLKSVGIHNADETAGVLSWDKMKRFNQSTENNIKEIYNYFAGKENKPLMQEVFFGNDPYNPMKGMSGSLEGGANLDVNIQSKTIKAYQSINKNIQEQLSTETKSPEAKPDTIALYEQYYKEFLSKKYSIPEAQKKAKTKIAEEIIIQQAIKPSGESGNLNIRILPGVAETAETLQRGYEEGIKTFAPYNKGEGGKIAAQTLRENTGKMARSNDKIEASLTQTKILFDKAKKEDNLNFIYKLESGEKQDTPNLQKITNILRDMLDSKRKEVQGLGTGKLENFIENYFPHIWEQPNKAQDVIRRIMGKRPLQGPKSFLKHRTIELTKDGIEAGLKPVSYNPIDLTMLKIREMDRYLMAHRTINALKEQGIVKFVKLGGEVPEGFAKINDTMADVYSRTEKNELILRGKYYAQEDAARIINNYLSPGLRGNYLYDLYRGAGNTLNQFQLSLSAFHLGFTSMDAIVSKFALGLNKLAQGNPLGATAEFLKSPFAPVTNFMQGKKLLQSWYGKDNGELTNLIADLMASAGGRARMDKFYAAEADKSIQKALQEGKILTATLRIPWWIAYKLSKPIMEYIVPRQKMGVFMDIMKMELERNPNINHEELVIKAQKAWDSVDNRMGQLVYDNLFWNKVTKDLSMASVRSLGWNLGTVRELGGGGKDTVKLLNDFRKGNKGEFTYRMAYLLALPIVAGIYGAIYHYLHTGKAPEELKDYYFPKTGALDKNGEPARVSLPTYMKDIYHYSKAPFRTILNKFNPVNNAVLQMLVNKDFYGTQIRNPDDPAVKQVVSELGFLGTQFVPFGIRNLQRDTRKTMESKVEPFIGIVPAPYDINMTPAEIKAQEYVHAKLPVGARTQESANKAKLEANLRNNLKANNDRVPIYQAIKEGKITSQEGNDILLSSREKPLQRYIKSLTVYELANVIKVATPEEKKGLIPAFYIKYGNKYNKSTADERKTLEGLKKEVLGK